jgi:hypothetical protein
VEERRQAISFKSSLQGMTVTEKPINGRTAPTRRSIMQAAIGAAGAAAAIVMSARRAAAAPTISKAAVAYQDQPEGNKECDKCVQFVAPSNCKIVEGAISPHGCCRIFSPLSQSS